MHIDWRSKRFLVWAAGVAVLLTVLITGLALGLRTDPDDAGPPEVRQARLAKFHMYANTAHNALEEARAFLSENGVKLPLFKDLSKEVRPKDALGPRICIGIQTAGRKASPINYLEQTVSALLTRMQLPDKDVYIHVFNVHNRSEHHKDIDTIADIVPVTSVKGELPQTIKVPMVPQFIESHDHREAMRVLDKIGCQYPILIEDDALPQEGWVDQIRDAIDQLENRGTDWFVVKLYIARAPKDERQDKSYVGLTDFDQGFNGVALMYNRKYMLEYGDSLVFHTREVMAGRLEMKLHEFKDTYMHVFKKAGYPLEAYEPPIFQHTGIYSSVSVRPLDKFPWFMESREFVSEGKPIIFNPRLWSKLVD